MIAKIKTNELTIGKWFKNIREEEKLTLKNLSLMSGFSVSTIYRIENNRSFPIPSTIIALLRIMFGDDDERFEKEIATYNTLKQRNILKQKEKNKERLGAK